MIVRRISEAELVPNGYQIYSQDYLTRTSLAAPYWCAWLLRCLKLLREKTVAMRPSALEKLVQESIRKGVDQGLVQGWNAGMSDWHAWFDRRAYEMGKVFAQNREGLPSNCSLQEVERAHEERKPKNPYAAGQSIEVKG